MQHLNEETLVAHHYRDAEDGAAVALHLRDCRDCAAQYEELRRVLALVDDASIPEPAENYGEEVWRRLRWKLGSEKRKRRGWTSLAAAAAALIAVFFLGQWWSARNVAPALQAEHRGTTPAGAQPVGTQVPQTVDAGAGNRILLVVVGDHLESSERMLLEVANADPERGLRNPSERAEELVASNRIYRQTAAQRGDARIANVLSDLEPILVELSHAGTTLSGSELSELQKRIDSKGLLFKVRVISARESEPARPTNPNTTSL
ncbi:MAG TPA: hypothetical protein VGF69_16920 [Thermoanaerobaculia bacterium]|jgi:hypothetical protein